MNNDFRFSIKKRCLIVAMSTVCALATASCNVSNYINKNYDSNSDEPVNSVSTDSTFYSASSDSSQESGLTVTSDTLETEDPTSKTTYIEGIGDVYVQEANYMSKNDFILFRQQLFAYGIFSLGVDNPKTLELARQYFKDDSLTLEDIGFFQCEDLGDADNDISNEFEDMRDRGFFLDFARYILSLNGDRFMIRQIDDEFFREYFPDFQAESDAGNDQGLRQEFLDERPYFLDLTRSCDNEGESELINFLSKHPNDSDAQEAVRYYIFTCLKRYSQAWFDFANGYSTVCNFMPITYDINGKIVVAPSPGTLDQLQRRVNEMSKCENLDITKVETYDDLLNSGINIDLLEQAFEYAGLDIPKLSEQLDQSSDQQRSRG